jgi:Zn ribbon nucleic-acid-binding protein
MSRMSDKLFEKLVIPLVVTVLTPIATALGSKIVSGSWTEWIEKVPIPAWIVFGTAMLLWIAGVLVRKRLKTIRESEIDYSPAWLPPYGWTEVYELEHAGVLWTVRAPAPEPWETFDPMSVSSSELNIATPPKCPKCRTELEEKLRFFGGYKWECIRCGFEKRNKDAYYRERRRALKLAKSDWESQRRSRSRKGSKYT